MAFALADLRASTSARRRNWKKQSGAGGAVPLSTPGVDRTRSMLIVHHQTAVAASGTQVILAVVCERRKEGVIFGSRDYSPLREV